MPTLLNASYQFESYAFDNTLPIPTTIDLTKRSQVVLQMREADVHMGLYGDAGEPLTTTVWGYGTPGSEPGYLGPTLLAEEGNSVTVHWQNQLPIGDHLLPVDTTLHLAEPIRKTLEAGYTPVVPHLHGGETDPQFDGYPEAWWTQTQGAPGPAEVGPFYAENGYKFDNKFTYDNDQQAAPLWYHDHALGITRLNVYAGLAGVYNLTDENEQAKKAANILPTLEIPLVIQDKAFTTDGELYYPALKHDPLPDGDGGSGSVVEEVGETFFEENGDDAASALPEFFGDHILVNGMAWPNLTVEQNAYTFNLLNGSDSRFYVLDFVTVDTKGTDDVSDDEILDENPEGLEIIGVAGDGGLFENPVTDLDEGFVLAPGDRLDLVVDFRGVEEGTEIRLINSGPAYEPFKGFVDPDDVTSDLAGDATAATLADPVGSVMQFTVDPDNADAAGDAIDLTTLNDPGYDLNTIADVPDPVGVRKVGLFEGSDEYGRVWPLLGTAKAGAVHDRQEDADGKWVPLEDAELKDFGPMIWEDPTTETPEVGTTETWQIFNFTADAHPIHLHLTQFEVSGRRDIMFEDGNEDGIPDDTNGGGISYGYYTHPTEVDFSQDDIWVSNTLRAPAAEEGGRQDTTFVATAEMLEIEAFFEKPGDYVWHCHILSHEDHEMMRPMEVVPEGSDQPFLDDALVA